MKKKATFIVVLCVTFALSTITSSAQVNVSVDHGKWASVPLVKKFGVNIPFDISLQDLENNAEAIKDLQLRIVRVHNGWGTEAAGKLVETSPITLADGKINYDFTALDKIIDLITQNGAKPTIVNGYGPKVLSDNFKTIPQDKFALWEELNGTVASHFNQLAIPIEIEVWDNISDNENSSFAGDAMDYTDLLGPSFNGLKNFRYVRVGYGGIDDTNLWAWRQKWGFAGNPAVDWKWIPKFLSSVWPSVDVIDHHLYKSTGLMEQCNEPWDLYEGQVSAFSMFGKNSADAVSAKAAVAFYESIRKISTGWVNNNSREIGPAGAKITKLFLDQLIDYNAGNKGLVSKTGAKSPLYFALKLYNEIPVDGKEIVSDNADISGFASSNETLAGIALWNQGASAQTVNLTQTALPFTADKIEIYRIDATNSSNGVLAVETVSSFPSSLSIPADGLVVIKMSKEGDKSMEKKTFGTFNMSKERNWFPYSEGWAWQTNFDPITLTTFMGCTQSVWGCVYKGVFYENIPDRIRVKISSFGGPMNWMDSNTACYFRIDYESEDEYGAYHQKKILFYDTSENYVFDATHGSQIDGITSPENERVGVDFSNPDGFVIDVNDFDVPDYSGNAILYFYLQNPGIANVDFIVKFELSDADNVPNAIRTVSDANVAVAAVYPTIISDQINIRLKENLRSTVEIFTLEGKCIYNTYTNSSYSIDASNFQQGIYLIKVKNQEGIVTQKVIK